MVLFKVGYSTLIYGLPEWGAAMRSPVSPILANICVEHLRKKPLGQLGNPPRFWKKVVDDTFVI